jgi:purine-binding chemotaxis protein CheW
MMNIAPSPVLTGPGGGPAASSHLFTVFRRKNQLFGLSIDLVREVLPGQPLTHVPRAQAQILGVLSLRGEILPVLAIDDLLCLDPPPEDPTLPILVLRRGELLLGLRVDAIHSVVSVPSAEVQPHPGSGDNPFLGIWQRPGGDAVTLIAGTKLLDALCAQTSSES